MYDKIFTDLPECEIYSALIGMILGDSCLMMHGVNARMQIGHSPNVLDYLKIKALILEQIPEVICRVGSIKHKNKRVKKEYDGIYLATTTHPLFTKLRQKFYRSHKILDIESLDQMTPLGLAIWYMDDGHLDLHHNKIRSKNDVGKKRSELSIGSRNIKIHTESFTKKENETLCEWLALKWDIFARIQKEKNKYFYIYMNTTNAKKFTDIVRPFILKVPSMRYKIDFKYKKVSPELERFNINL